MSDMLGQEILIHPWAAMDSSNIATKTVGSFLLHWITSTHILTVVIRTNSYSALRANGFLTFNLKATLPSGLNGHISFKSFL